MTLLQNVCDNRPISLSSGHSYKYDKLLGKVLSLDDSHTFSEGGDPQNLDESQGFSVSLWLNPADDTSKVVVGRDGLWYVRYGADFVTLVFNGVSMSCPVVTAANSWQHLIVSIYPTGSDHYAGDVYVNGQHVGDLEDADIGSFASAGNLVLGGFDVSESRFPPLSVGSSSDRWESETNDNIIDAEASVDDDPAAYTDSTYWWYVYNAVDDWLTPQFVSGHEGSSSYPVGLRFRMVAMIDNHGCESCTTTVLHRITISFHNGVESQQLVDWFPGNDPEDGIEIPPDYEPHLIEVDLETLPVEGWSDIWAVNVVFSSQGTGSHTVTLYDFDLIEAVPSYRGLLKDIRFYNRPIAQGEVLQIYNHAERLYEQPSVFSQVWNPHEDIEGTFTATATLACNAGVMRVAEADLTATANLYCNASKDVYASADLTAEADLTAAIIYRARARAALEATADLVATANADYVATTDLTAKAVVATAVNYDAGGAAALTATASMACSASVKQAKDISADLTATGALSANAGFRLDAEADLTATGAIAAEARRTRSVAGALTATGTMSATAEADKEATADLTAKAVMAAAATKEAEASTTLAATASMACSAFVKQAKDIAADLTATGTLSAYAGFRLDGEADLTATGTIAAAAKRTRRVAGALTATGTMSAAGIAEHEATADLTANAVMACSATVGKTQQVTGNLKAKATMACSANVVKGVSASLRGTAALLATANGDYVTAADLTATASMAASARVKKPVDISSALTAKARMGAAAEIGAKPTAAADLTAKAMMACSANVVKGVSASLRGIASILVVSNEDYAATADLTATASMFCNADYRPNELMAVLYGWLEPQLSCDLYPLILPIKPAFPAVVYYRSGSEFNYRLNGTVSDQKTTSLTFDVFAQSYEQADTITQELLTALHGYSGYIGSVKVFAAEVSNVSDASFYTAGASHEGVIKTVDIDLIHNMQTTLSDYTHEDEAGLRERIRSLIGNAATFVPDVSSDRPVVSIERTGNGLMQFLDDGENDGDDKGFEIIVSSYHYKDSLALAKTIRQGLGITVDDEYDQYDYDPKGRPLYEVVLNLEA